MGYILVDQADHDFSVNFWNWGALHEAVRVGGVIPDDVWGPMREAFGPPLPLEYVAPLREFLETQVLTKVAPGQRVLLTGEVTSHPDDGVMHYDIAEQWKNYSLDRRVLLGFIEYLKTAQGAIRIL